MVFRGLTILNICSSMFSNTKFLGINVKINQILLFRLKGLISNFRLKPIFQHQLKTDYW